MDRERLTILADFLDTVPQEKFNIHIWFSRCRTAGCALGWATQIPEFKKDGLKLCIGDGGFNAPCYKHRYCDSAAQDFFGLTCAESGRIFYNQAYLDANVTVTPKAVACRIRDMLTCTPTT